MLKLREQDDSSEMKKQKKKGRIATPHGSMLHITRYIAIRHEVPEIAFIDLICMQLSGFVSVD